MGPRSPVGTDVTALFEDLEAVAERARSRAEDESEGAESTSGVPMEGPDGAPAQPSVADLDRATKRLRTELLQDGARGLDKVARDPDADLTQREQFGVEAIVLLEGRPALLVQDGDFPENLPLEWTLLGTQRDAIRKSIARVGRVEVTGHPSLDWVGTGFLVADDLLMTNRHVAIEFSRRDGETWSFVSGRSADFDLLEEAGTPGQAEFAVTEVVGIHDADDVDLALLRVQPTGRDASVTLPSPLPIARTAPDEVAGRPVYVVGYPAWDGRRNEPEPMRAIFMDVYNVKRLQPGLFMESQSPNTVLRHDCSTLGGNSGSPVFDLGTHQVMGLHFGGRYGAGNYAVPLWRLVNDPLIATAAINYEGGPGPAPTAAAMGPWPEIRRGSQQHPVRTVQYLLRARGHRVIPDGVFGPRTEAAVRAFQREKRLAGHGIVDPSTWTSLVIKVGRGDSGDAVRAVQEELQFRASALPGQALRVDGLFGRETEEVVRAFQAALGQGEPAFQVDGIVGVVTWRALVSGMLVV